MRIGYDLDGVICEEPKWLDWLFRLNVKLAVFIRDRFSKVKYYPVEKEYTIITGRPEEDRKSTERWLNRNRLSGYTLYMSDRECTTIQSILFKSEIINNLSIEKYIESDDYTVRVLSKLVKNCQIVRFKGEV